MLEGVRHKQIVKEKESRDESNGADKQKERKRNGQNDKENKKDKYEMLENTDVNNQNEIDT